MTTPHTVRANLVAIAFKGIPFSGFADGSFVAWTRNNPAFALKVGSAGEGGRASTGDKSGTVTVTLLQTSIVNGVLSALAKADEDGGDGVGLLIIKDLSGLTIVKAEAAWVQKHPDGEYSNEVTNRVWVFETDVLDIFDGGNPV